jgi:sugar phosphate isomerase/epimerase
MAQTAINLYSVRELDEPMLDILDRVADAGYDGVQFSGGLRDASPDEVKEKLEETGLEPTGAHVGIDDLEHDLESTREIYQETLGCDSAVVPYLSADHFGTVEAVEHTAGRLTSLGHRLSSADWALHYHNHAHEFIELEADERGRNGFERFIDSSNKVGIELDVGWVLYGGEDPVELIEAYGDRMDLIHMKDVDVDAERDDCFREIGDGDVDMQACADAAREAGASWLIYEHDAPEDPAATIDAGAEYLNSL